MSDSAQDVGRTLHGAEESLPACFERLAAVHRARTALGAGAWQPTYHELNETANGVAHDEQDEEHECRVAFDAGSYHRAGVHKFTERFGRLLDDVSRDPGLTLRELLARGAASRHGLGSFMDYLDRVCGWPGDRLAKATVVPLGLRPQLVCRVKRALPGRPALRGPREVGLRHPAKCREPPDESDAEVCPD